MATDSDVTVAQDGAGNIKLHPYLITLIRWCVSCLWSTASVVLHRLVTAQLPPISAAKQGSKLRQAGTDHLHPEPKVECVVLHTPATPTLDVIFVHGLYGSLGNTWRQGDWKSKYKSDPPKIPLRNYSTPTSNTCNCQTKPEQPYNNIHFTYETNLNETEINETVSFQQINGCFKKILPHENALITEKFYNNTLLNVNINNYETQGKFVTELFKNDCNKTCDLKIETCKCNLNGNVNKCGCTINETCKLNECECKINEKLSKCEVGCGCICDDCYSSCWPRDWIKEDFPGARVISINYTSDPYLWRPLWVKSCKRLRLHERAEQMMEQLLDLGVGKRPIIWVGHSKGGLFIKQIFCEAYDAYMKMNKNINENKINNNIEDQSSRMLFNNYDTINDNEDNDNRNIEMIKSTIELTNNICFDKTFLQNMNKENKLVSDVQNVGCDGEQVLGNKEYIDVTMYSGEDTASEEAEEERDDSNTTLNNQEDRQVLESRSSLWQQSAGFMFYSVPHRGSPLAAIKTPITSRSIELLEISKDCRLVSELQARWLVAVRGRPAPPPVRSVVETRRTLMSVLWLRIVSVDSADAGVGSLLGVGVDHREICKPSSRRCRLYAELAALLAPQPPTTTTTPTSD